MTQLSELRRIWQEPDDETIIRAGGKKEVTLLLEGRTADLKKQILKRVTAEIKTYLLIGLFMLCLLSIERWSTGRTVLLGAGSLLIMVPAVCALAFKEYRLRTLPMSGSLRESIAAVIHAIDSTARSYLVAYIASVSLSVTLIEILLIRKNGWTPVTVLLIAIGVAFISWSYFSGRQYASRMFRRYRSELVNALSELDSV